MVRLPDEETVARLARLTWERCDRLAQCSEEPGRLTRTFLSPPMRAVHAELSSVMEACGMTVRVDAVGNLIGRYAAAGAETARNEPARAFLIGSHLDTVPNAGKYDGALGVLLGLAVVEALGGQRLPFALDVVGFSEEEGVRYRTPYLGSRALAGTFAPELLDLRDNDGVSLRDSLEAFGLDPTRIFDAAYPPEAIVGYLEAHIEQGPVLEARGVPVGIVSAIAGQSRLRLVFTGRAAHAGTTPMGMRRDALAGAAEFIGAVETLGRDTPGLVATVGAVSVSPNAGNVIPGDAEISLDVRHADDEARLDALHRLLQSAEHIAQKRGLELRVRERADFAAVHLHADLRCLLGAAIAQENLPVLEIVSGAGHDAAIVAAHASAAMLFVRGLHGGISHHPDEAVLLEDIETALRVMLHFVWQLALNFTSPLPQPLPRDGRGECRSESPLPERGRVASLSEPGGGLPDNWSRLAPQKGETS